MRPRAALFGLLWTVVAGAVLAFAPFGESSTTSAASDGTSSVVTTTRESLLEHEGASVLVVLAVPVVLTAGGWAAARRRWRPGVVASAIVLTVGVVLALLSVGAFYLPATIAMVVAATGR
ncbi:MAG TPA: hypothetical protein VFK42_20155 [Acidimicrobiales bacterium]|nr:hypothetical protein [Acidimicrobiales bacterium]